MTAVCVSGLVAAGCRDWDAELTEVLNRLSDAGQVDGGAVDAGPDAGPVDAGRVDSGCPTSLCFVQSLRAGTEFGSLVSLGPGSFMAYGGPYSGDQVLGVSSAGGSIDLLPLPTALGLASAIAGPSADDVFLATDTAGAAHYAGEIVNAGGACGLSPLNPTWLDVSAASGAEAVFVGSPAAVCTWTPGAGFVGSDLSALDSNGLLSLTGVLVLSSGERFMVGNEGALLFSPASGATPMLSWHSVGKSAHYNFKAISGPDVNTVWAVGDYGMLAHWVPNGSGGGSWAEPTAIAGMGSATTDLWVRTNEDIWLVGRGGLLKHFDGAIWSDVMAANVSPSVHLRAVMGTGAMDLILAGSDSSAGVTLPGMIFVYRRGN